MAAVMAAACLLTGAAAFAEIQYRSIPRSTLVSKPELRFKLAPQRRGDAQVMVLVHQPAHGEVVPVAEISSSNDRVAFSLLPAAARADLKVVTLEHLYVLAMRQDPEATFSFDDRKQLSHTELLRGLVQARGRAAQGSGAGAPWTMLSMAPARSGGDDEVAVTVKNASGPMKGVAIYFNRAPHSTCHAKTDDAGLARCQLVDQHGDEEAHGDEGKVAVVATFPGDVGKDRVLVPMTLVMRPQ